jgi:hypothetical protein
MWQTTVVCSGCADEYEITVEDLDAVEREICPCGHCVIMISVAGFEPIYAAS